MRRYKTAVCLLAILLGVASPGMLSGRSAGERDAIRRPVLSVISSCLLFPAALFGGGLARMFLFFRTI